MVSTKSKSKKELQKRYCLRGLKVKEDNEYAYTAIVATTHPDRVGDILSVNALGQIIDYTNNADSVGGQNGAYTSVSLYHDWIHEGDPSKDEAAFIQKGSARMIDMDNGHKGVEVDLEINQYYKGDLTPDEIKYRVDHGGIAGLSIEYDTDDSHCRTVTLNNNEYRYIEELTEYGGSGLARARKIANPHAVFYKEIEDKVKNNNTMEANKMDATELELKEKELLAKEKELQDKEVALKKKEEEKPTPEPEPEPLVEVKEKPLIVKEIFESKEFNEFKESLKVDSKIIKTKEGDNKMEGIQLQVKELKDSVKGNDILSFKETARRIWSTKEYNDSLKKDFEGHGVILKPSSISVDYVKEKGNFACKEIESCKMKMVGGLQTKDTLDTGGNTTTYTQSPVEFSDLYVPGLLDTFNNRTDLFDALTKVNHIMGTPDYAWRITASQKSSLSVDVDDPTITKSFMDKVKLKTPIKEYRNGISVMDFMISHSRASIGDLFMIEAEKAMMDMRKDLNVDLYEETADGTGEDILGLEAVADSTGNTTLYGYTRSVANRLKTSALGNTYTDVSGALTTDNLRTAYRYVWEDGAQFSDLMIVTSPAVRQALFELLDGQQQLFTAPDFGFSGAIRFDGIPVLVDSDCPSTATQRQLYVIDKASDIIVISVPPQLRGLAKVSAAEEAYVMVNLAHVYLNPRRIHMLDNLS